MSRPLAATRDGSAEAGAADLPVPPGRADRLDAVLAELLPPLQRLDALLELARCRAAERYGPDAEADPWRGLCVDDAEVAHLLGTAPGRPLCAGGVAAAAAPAAEGSRLAWLRVACGLSDFDVDVVVLALAVELDRRYERVYAYLQDHIERHRPTVDLALQLLCADAGERLERRRRFAVGAPLLRFGLVSLTFDRDPARANLLSAAITLDDQVVQFLLHQDTLDVRISAVSRLVPPAVTGTSTDDPALDNGLRGTLRQLFTPAPGQIRPVRVYLEGADVDAERVAVAAVAAELGRPLLEVDVPAVVAADGMPDGLWPVLCRAAWLEGAVSYWAGVDPASATPLLKALTQVNMPAVLAGAAPWGAAGPHCVLLVTVAGPNFAQRRGCWERHLQGTNRWLAAADLDALADRFRLTRTQIAAAVATAGTGGQGSDAGPAGGPRPVAELFAAARAVSGHPPAGLVRRIEPCARWQDLVLPEAALEQLRAICIRVEQRPRVLESWGFGCRLPRGKGITALFAGPSGTGKTLAAEVVAAELSLELYRVDLSGVVSKYIGETEKNLAQVFAVADRADAVLLFDEADALFGKRSAVSDAHDRYANIEISYLLQRMEDYDGIAVLATNLRQNLDDAFLRRLAFAVHFPFPDVAGRRRIWEGIWPPRTPLAPDVDADVLAERYRFSGGNIRNVALAAAFAAAAEDRPVGMAHLHRVAEYELEKMGRNPSAAAPGDY